MLQLKLKYETPEENLVLPELKTSFNLTHGLSFLNKKLYREPFAAYKTSNVLLHPLDSNELIKDVSLGGFRPGFQRKQYPLYLKEWIDTFKNHDYEPYSYHAEYCIAYVSSIDNFYLLDGQQRLTAHSKTDEPIESLFQIFWCANVEEAEELYEKIGRNSRQEKPRTNLDSLHSLKCATGRKPWNSKFENKISKALSPAVFGLEHKHADRFETEHRISWLDRYDSLTEMSCVRKFENILLNSKHKKQFNSKHIFFGNLMSPGLLAVQLECLASRPEAIPFLADIWNVNLNNPFVNALYQRLDVSTLSGAIKDLDESVREKDNIKETFNGTPYSDKVNALCSGGHSSLSKKGRYILKCYEFVWNHYIENNTISTIKMKPSFFCESYNFKKTKFNANNKDNKIVF